MNVRKRQFSIVFSNVCHLKGAEVVGRGMVKGAVKTSEYLFYGSEYAKQYITPEITAREVDPKLRQSLEAARCAL